MSHPAVRIVWLPHLEGIGAILEDLVARNHQPVEIRVRLGIAQVQSGIERVRVVGHAPTCRNPAGSHRFEILKINRRWKGLVGVSEHRKPEVIRLGCRRRCVVRKDDPDRVGGLACQQTGRIVLNDRIGLDLLHGRRHRTPVKQQLHRVRDDLRCPVGNRRRHNHRRPHFGAAVRRGRRRHHRPRHRRYAPEIKPGAPRAVDARNFEVTQQPAPDAQVIHEKVHLRRPAIGVKTGPVLPQVHRPCQVVRVEAAHRRSRVRSHVRRVHQRAVHVYPGHVRPLECQGNLVPTPIHHGGRHMGTIPSAGPAVIVQVPFHSVGFAGDDPPLVATAAPVLVADERLVVGLVQNFRPERKGEIGRVARCIAAEFQDGRIA